MLLNQLALGHHINLQKFKFKMFLVHPWVYCIPAEK